MTDIKEKQNRRRADLSQPGDRETTRHLSRVLQNMKRQKDADVFIENHGEGTPRSFHEYMRQRMKESGLDRGTVISRSGISKNYVYNILNGSKPNPGRDKVLALCIAAELDYAQTQKALEIAGLAPLYPRSERDVRIAIAINNGMNRVIMVNLMLDEYGLPPLDV